MRTRSRILLATAVALTLLIVVPSVAAQEAGDSITVAGMTAQPLTSTSATWTASTPGPDRWDPSWTFLPATTCRGLAFGGITYSGYRPETLLFDPVAGSWEQLTFQSSKRPSNRAGAGLSFDSVRSRAVLFGGHGNTGALRDTWTFSPAARKWTKAIGNCNARNVCPPARTLQGQVFSAFLGQTVVFGGLGTGLQVPLNDVWVFDGTWSQVSTTNAPPARSRFGMAEDATNGKIVVFGGLGSGDVVLSDTWILDPARLTWTQVPAGPTPAGKFLLAMSYAPSLGGVVAHSGADAAGNQTNETWAFDFAESTWVSITTNTTPPPRTDALLAADTCAGQAILFGAPDARHPPPTPQINDTWILQ